MKIEIETSSYNEKRYGRPWIARVIFNAAHSDFQFGEWVGRDGYDGLLVLEAQPGEIIARGQKDLRNSKNNGADYYVLQADASLVPISKVDAYKHDAARREAMAAATEQLDSVLNDESKPKEESAGQKKDVAPRSPAGPESLGGALVMLDALRLIAFNAPEWSAERLRETAREALGKVLR